MYVKKNKTKEAFSLKGCVINEFCLTSDNLETS